MFRIVSLLGCLLLTIILGVPSALAANKALSLDGSGDYVEMPYIPLDNRSFTVEVWLKATNLPGDVGVVSQREADITDKYLHLNIRYSKPYMGFYYNDLSGTITLSPNVWYHITYLYDIISQKQKIYVNGMLDAERTTTAYQGTAGNTLIGTYGGSFFNGQIAEVRIWNVARTQEDIRRDINQPIENPELLEHLVGYWNFDGGTAEDLSQYDNDGALQGDATIVEEILPKVIFVPTPEYPTIQSGIDAANPGDTVIVDPGIYYENIIISKNGITLQGSGAGVTTIDGGGSGVYFYTLQTGKFTATRKMVIMK